LALNSDNADVWAVNPDNDSVSLIKNETLVREIDLGRGCEPRAVALDYRGDAWVTCHRDDSIKVVDAGNFTVRRFALPYGSAPFGIVIEPSSGLAYVSLYGSAAVAAINRDGKVIGKLEGLVSARALALAPGGRRLLVTRFISDAESGDGEVYDIELRRPEILALQRTLRIVEDTVSADTNQSGRGAASYLSSIAIDHSGRRAWVAAKKDNIRGGLFRSGLDLGQSNTVRAILAQIDLEANVEDFERRIDVDNADSPSSIAFSPENDYVFVTAQGNNQVYVYDMLRTGGGVNFVPTVMLVRVGDAPQGILFDSRNMRFVVQNFQLPGVSFIPAGAYLSGLTAEMRSTSLISVPQDRLSPKLRIGKRIFYNSADGLGSNGQNRMSAEGYISCATCHIDGGHDGRTWDFTGRGEGLRNTTDLRGRGGTGHGRVHWSANFDEIQDFENDIRNSFGGAGFMSDADFILTSDTLGTKKAGRSADLDALAEFVTSLGQESLPRSPHRNADGTVSISAITGARIFTALNCQKCHTPPQYTDSELDASVLHDVGTLTTASGFRLGGPLTGIDTPTVLGVFSSAPYLHDGSAESLDQIFPRSNPDAPEGQAHSRVSRIDSNSYHALVSYLLQLDGRPMIGPRRDNRRMQQVADSLLALEDVLDRAFLKAERLSPKKLQALKKKLSKVVQLISQEKAKKGLKNSVKRKLSAMEKSLRRQDALLSAASRGKNVSLKPLAGVLKAIKQANRSFEPLFLLSDTN
jgi:DNA-binding beta-propeller fold protein YncE